MNAASPQVGQGGGSATYDRRLSRSAVGLAAVLLVAALGALLTLQGWRSRIPDADLLTTIAASHELLESGRLPDRGALTSFASFTPPGAAWLMAPGMIVFRDPRLFDFIGSLAFFLGTLLGIFLLARTYLGYQCAILSSALYGLSELGLSAAGSLWQRYPIHCFYVWMVYWVGKWATKNDSRFLAAGIVTWAMGMYVFMEIAPAIVVVPVIWLLYRPSLRIVPLIWAGILSAVIWYPYLRFESGRDFVDLKSQVLRQQIRPVNFEESWCDPATAPLTWRANAGPSQVESGSVPPSLAPAWTRAGQWSVIRGALIVNELLISNFKTSARIPGASLGLLAMTLAGLCVLCFRSGNPGPGQLEKRAWSNRLKRLGVASAVCGLLFNEVVIARYLSPDGIISPSPLATIRILQAILLILGLLLIVGRHKIPAVLARSAGAVPVPAADTTLLAISLVVPWILMLLISESGRPERFWWMWPLQVMVLASVVTYLPIRFRAPRGLMWISALMLLVVVGGNSLLLARLDAWGKDGWSGRDAPEISVVDEIANQKRSGGKTQAAIGYEVFINPFEASFNKADPRYKVGADFDVLFQYRRGITNLDRCAEGVAADDEYRIVQRTVTDPNDTFRLDISRDAQFQMMQQFGVYQVFHRH